jgi:hypothetical protein
VVLQPAIVVHEVQAGVFLDVCYWLNSLIKLHAGFEFLLMCTEPHHASHSDWPNPFFDILAVEVPHASSEWLFIGEELGGICTLALDFVVPVVAPTVVPNVADIAGHLRHTCHLCWRIVRVAWILLSVLTEERFKKFCIILLLFLVILFAALLNIR